MVEATRKRVRNHSRPPTGNGTSPPAAASATAAISKREAVRQALRELGNTATPAQIVPWLAQRGIVIGTSMCSNYKSAILGTTTAARKAAFAGAAARPGGPASTTPPGQRGIGREDRETLNRLVDRYGPETLAQFVGCLSG